MSYLNELKRLFYQKTKWDYYGCHYQNTLEDVFIEPENFINETFLRGQKQKLVARNDNMPNISPARAAHSISSFFMGFIIAYGLSTNSLQHFCQVKQENFPFSYVWFLTSLYHDFGYRFEYDAKLANRIFERIRETVNRPYINSYFNGALYHLRKDREISIIHSPWSVYFTHSFRNAKRDLDSSPKHQIQEYIVKNHRELICNGQYIQMPVRNSKTVDNYLKYRLLGDKNHKCIDHGISGGMLFYDRIIKNYINKYERKKMNVPDIKLEEFFENTHERDLRFSLEQLIVFMYVSDCIINHNIWKATTDLEEVYRHYKLDSLIGDKYKKVNFEKNPLLFILAMSDTLEPYKNFYAACHGSGNIDIVNYNAREVLSAYEKINVEFSKNQIIMQVSKDLLEACRTRLLGMEQWIDIKCEEINDGFIINIL